MTELRYGSLMQRGLQPLTATALVGTGSLAALALSVVSMKAYAVLVGPDGVGLYALLQSVLSLAVLAASIGLQASAVRAVAAVDAEDGLGATLLIARTAMLIALAAGTVGGIALLLLRDPIAQLMLGTHERSQNVLLLAPALLLTVIATVGGALLAGMRRLKAATVVTVLTALAAATVGIALVGAIGLAGFAPSMAAVAAIHFILTAYALRRAGIRLMDRPILPPWDAVRPLVAFGVPVAFSQAVTTGAMLLVPVIVLQTLGSSEVGYYRAAAAVSIGVGTFFLAGIHQDFLPRISAADDPLERATLIERRMRIVVGIGLPIILMLLAVSPLVIDLLYTNEFRPAVVLLQWQLVGDLARLPTLVLASAAFAVRSRATYIGIETFSGVTVIAGTLVGIAVLGLAGPGVGYAAAQAITYLATWIAIRSRLRTSPGRLQAVVGATLLGASLILVADVSQTIRLAIFLLLAVVTAVASGSRLVRLHRASEL